MTHTQPNNYDTFFRPEDPIIHRILYRYGFTVWNLHTTSLQIHEAQGKGKVEQKKMNKIIRKVINSPNAPKAIGPYSQAVQVNHILHISGQLGLNPKTGEFISDNVAEQTKQALNNIGSILQSAGTSFENVIETTILLADINDYGSVNEVYASFFKSPYPARAAYECANLPKYGKVEIKAQAIVGDVEDQ